MNKLLIVTLALSTVTITACGGGGGGSASTSGLELQRGVAVNGFVEEDKSIVYNIEGLGVTQIQLTSTSGDADLVVFDVSSINPDPLSDDNIDDIICSSANSSAVDTCIITAGTGRLVGVAGFTDASFQLIVE